jgi:hypothetical protein
MNSNLSFTPSVQNLSSIISVGSNKDTVKIVDGDSDKVIENATDSSIKSSLSVEDILCREVGFVMLQLVNGLKNLQAKGIEEMPLSLSNVILCREADNKDAQARLCVLQG